MKFLQLDLELDQDLLIVLFLYLHMEVMVRIHRSGSIPPVILTGTCITLNPDYIQSNT